MLQISTTPGPESNGKGSADAERARLARLTVPLLTLHSDFSSRRQRGDDDHCLVIRTYSSFDAIRPKNMPSVDGGQGPCCPKTPKTDGGSASEATYPDRDVKAYAGGPETGLKTIHEQCIVLAQINPSSVEEYAGLNRT